MDLLEVQDLPEDLRIHPRSDPPIRHSTGHALVHCQTTEPSPLRLGKPVIKLEKNSKRKHYKNIF